MGLKWLCRLLQPATSSEETRKLILPLVVKQERQQKKSLKKKISVWEVGSRIKKLLEVRKVGVGRKDGLDLNQK